MAKSIYVILLMCCLFSSALGKGTGKLSFVPRNGFFVVDNVLGLHGNSQLVVFSDLYLDSATIQGSGTLVLLPKANTIIISKNSKVSNLEIQGNQRVVLHGDLEIISSLKLDHSALDITPGRLFTNPNTNLSFLNGGNIVSYKFLSSTPQSSSTAKIKDSVVANVTKPLKPLFCLNIKLSLLCAELLNLPAVMLDPDLRPPQEPNPLVYLQLEWNS